MFGITADKAPFIQNAILYATQNSLKATTVEGKPARIAIVDENNTIIEDSDDVATAAHILTTASYNSFLKEKGALVELNPKNLFQHFRSIS